MKIRNKLHLIVTIILLFWFTYCQIGSCDVSSNQTVISINSTELSILTDLTKKNCTEVNKKLTKRNFNDDLNKVEVVKSRRKRYVAFPEGSSFSVAFCATIGFVGNPSFIYFSWAINWGLAYDLPNETWILNQKYRNNLPKPLVQRRHRRDLYERLETAMDNMGYNGRACILRTLCESAQYFYKKGSNMIEELVRTAFTLPATKVLPFEHNDLLEYDDAHRKGKSKVFCPATYPDCSFSLIDLALGEYSIPYNYM